MSSNATTNETSNVTSLPSTPKAQTAKEVIAANVKLLIEQLEAGHSEGLTAYLTAMGRFHNYSLGNILEIARQRPSATRPSQSQTLSEFSVPLLPIPIFRPSLSFSLAQFVLKFLNRRQGAFQFFWKRGGKLIFGDADRF